MNDDLPKGSFWMVYGIGAGRPTYQHLSRHLAEEEARRLARQNPGRVFVVLEAVSAVVKREFDTITLRASADRTDEIPF